MAEVRVSEGFWEDFEAVWSKPLRARISSAVELLVSMPLRGSSLDLSEAALRACPEGARRISVPPFDVIYSFDELEDVVWVRALVHARRA